MSLRTDRSNVLLGIVTLATILTVLPACSATAQHNVARPDCPPGTDLSRNIVFRPISRLPTRTFYLSSYAGYTYPPLGQRVPVDPSCERTARRPIFSGWFGGR